MIIFSFVDQSSASLCLWIVSIYNFVDYARLISVLILLWPSSFFGLLIIQCLLDIHLWVDYFVGLNRVALFNSFEWNRLVMILSNVIFNIINLKLFLSRSSSLFEGNNIIGLPNNWRLDCVRSVHKPKCWLLGFSVGVFGLFGLGLFVILRDHEAKRLLCLTLHLFRCFTWLFWGLLRSLRRFSCLSWRFQCSFVSLLTRWELRVGSLITGLIVDTVLWRTLNNYASGSRSSFLRWKLKLGSSSFTRRSFFNLDLVIALFILLLLNAMRCLSSDHYWLIVCLLKDNRLQIRNRCLLTRLILVQNIRIRFNLHFNIRLGLSPRRSPFRKSQIIKLGFLRLSLFTLFRFLLLISNCFNLVTNQINFFICLVVLDIFNMSSSSSSFPWANSLSFWNFRSLNFLF